MSTIQRTTSVTVDDTVFMVEKMDQKIQNEIALMDEWRQLEVDYSIQLSMSQAALRDIQKRIYEMIQAEIRLSTESEAVDENNEQAAE